MQIQEITFLRFPAAAQTTTVPFVVLHCKRDDGIQGWNVGEFRGSELLTSLISVSRVLGAESL
jgi:hypothetical protein